MSKQQKVPKTQEKQTHPEYPVCMNKKQAQLVCLNPSCKDHAFFCMNCENDECEIVHHHGNKLMSVSFKQYIKRVLKQRKMDEQLQQAINRYAECLEKLKKDVQQFVEKQLNQLEQIKRKAQQMGEEQQKIIQKLRKKQYTGINGTQLDHLWQKVSQFDNKQKNKETIQFLSIKQQQIKQISDNFEKVNNMELEDYMDENDNEQEERNSQNVSKQSKQTVKQKPNIQKDNPKKVETALSKNSKDSKK